MEEEPASLALPRPYPGLAQALPRRCLGVARSLRSIHSCVTYFFLNLFLPGVEGGRGESTRGFIATDKLAACWHAGTWRGGPWRSVAHKAL